MVADIKKFEMDEDLKKKIESTKFVFLVAASGIGKTFSGDYLEAIRGWKHIDGDVVLKESSTNPEYKDAFDQMVCDGDYADKDEEWKQNECFKAHHKILAGLALEGARDSNTVVLTHATNKRHTRIFLTQQLKDAGARDVSMVFLHCDADAHMDALWKRHNRVAAQGGSTAAELFKPWAPSVVDLDSFVEWFRENMKFDAPDESEQPYKVVDVTAKDVTVFDGLDEAFGIDSTTKRRNRGGEDSSYDELVLAIRAVDEKRDQAWMDRNNLASSSEREVEDSAEQEIAEQDIPEKQQLAARCSILMEFDKLDASVHLSDRRSSVLSSSSRRASFIKTGRFEE